MTTASPLIRPGLFADLPALTALYNRYIETTPITFDLEPFTESQREPWFRQFAVQGRYRLLVAAEDGEPVGYASSTPFKARGAYATSVECTVYLSPQACGKGLGRRLYRQLFEALADEDIHRAYGLVTLPNPKSERLHESLNFRAVGLFSEVGRKFDRYWDVKLYERSL